MGIIGVAAGPENAAGGHPFQRTTIRENALATRLPCTEKFEGSASLLFVPVPVGEAWLESKID